MSACINIDSLLHKSVD